MEDYRLSRVSVWNMSIEESRGSMTHSGFEQQFLPRHPLIAFEPYPEGVHPGCCCSWPLLRSWYLLNVAWFWFLLFVSAYFTYALRRPVPRKDEEDDLCDVRKLSAKQSVGDIFRYHDESIDSCKEAAEALDYCKAVFEYNSSAISAVETRLRHELKRAEELAEESSMKLAAINRDLEDEFLKI
ncbi:hypothetical protein QR680_016738 [Steinernema hermaphroditum]|uniref:Uncharacterized protein n=1 Tax=Steinernema hermaphroditum TaxID=289476 RepID=A0AA39HD94_9BILA|nr:hypothetical protein QR680_016738 [Steinernema hermaphroditum]